MSGRLRLGVLVNCLAMCAGLSSEGAPVRRAHEMVAAYEEVDRMGVIGVMSKPIAKVPQDTIWIADWNFEGPGVLCDDTGWNTADNQVVESDHHWNVNADFSGTGGISGEAAVLAEHNLCWVYPDGYNNDWYDAIRIEYSGDVLLSFDYLVDSESGFDFLQVETDSACASFDLAQAAGGRITPKFFRQLWFQNSGLNDSGRVDSLALTGYGDSGPHCLFISFHSDGGFSPADGNQSTTFGVATVIDNIELVGGSSYSQDFTAGNTSGLSFVSLAYGRPLSEPEGGWARLYRHITDNDLCTENKTCAWLHTDYGPEDPTFAYDPSMAFAPGSYVLANPIDEIVLSPWVEASLPSGSETILSMRRFPGNEFATGHIVQNWSVRGKFWIENTDTPAPDDSIPCSSPWGHVFQWNSLNFFGWTTELWSMNGYFPDNATELQVRFRVADWDIVIGEPPPTFWNTGPGPFWDRVRIGRIVNSGPSIDQGIDSRHQGQDAFATDAVTWSGPSTQESFVPRTTPLGTVAFSTGAELGINLSSPNLITGDSITVDVQDVRDTGGISTVEVYACIVEGPHAGQAPPPLAVGNGGSPGFFTIAAEKALDTNGNIVAGRWFVDMDDDYFLPGDVLYYFWLAKDQGGGLTSLPFGLASLPATLEEAQTETNGLFEVSFLPKLNWDDDLLAAAQTGPHGKIDQSSIDNPPASWTDEFGEVAEQANCLLYYQGVNADRRSGDVNHTTFMYTLDVLGYSGQYDVYDHQGFGNTNNHLGGRATIKQASGYALIIYDQGNRAPSGNLLPDGSDIDSQKIRQGDWFQDYLNAAVGSRIGTAGLWFVSANAVEEKPMDDLFTTEMGLSFVSGNQGSNLNPRVDGVATMTYANGNQVDYTSDLFSVQGGCPTIRDYDALTATTGIETHLWKDPNSAALGDAAIVQNANVGLNWNTIMQAFPLFDIRGELPADQPERELMADILLAIVPNGCLSQTATGLPGGEVVQQLPSTMTFHGVYPNPFNPMTTIRFDVPRPGPVSLRIYDVAGRLVDTLVDGELDAGRYSMTWNGLQAGGQPAASGIYFAHLSSALNSFSATRKIVMAK